MHTAFLINQLAPYRRPLLEAIDERLPGGVGVVALTESEPNRDWTGWEETRFPVRVLKGRTVVLGSERFLHLRAGVAAALADWRPRVLVVGGWDAPAYWSGLVSARRERTPVAVWTGSHAGSGVTRGARALLRRTFLARVDLVLAYGEKAAAFAAANGVLPARIATVGNPIACEPVAQAAERFARSAEGLRLAADLARPAFLFAGQLVDRKRVLETVDAVAEAAPGASLLVAGAGPREDAVRQRLADHPALDARMLGAVSPERVWELLGVVDALLLLSSEEVWGLVVNEALAAGVLPVVSSAAGAAELLAQAGVGVIAGADSTAAVRTAVACLPLAAEERGRLRTAAQAGGVVVAADRFAASLERLATEGRRTRRLDA